MAPTTELQSGPIQAIGTYLYQLNITPGHQNNNLWAGHLYAQNRHSSVHLEKAVKLFLAAEDMLAALKLAREEFDNLPRSLGYTFTHLPAIDAAITKATL